MSNNTSSGQEELRNLVFNTVALGWSAQDITNKIMDLVSHHTQEAVKAARLEDNHDWDTESFKAQGVIVCRRCATTYQTMGNKPCTGEMAKVALRATPASLASTAPQNTSLSDEEE